MKNRIGKLFGVVAALFCTAACGQDTLLKNTDFSDWRDSLPSDWQVQIAAKNGAASPKSKVQKIAGPALGLSGDSKTRAWHSVSQTVAVQPGRRYRLNFEAYTKEINRADYQFDNCYVGWMSLDNSGQLLQRSLQDLSKSTNAWKSFSVDHRVPAGTEKTEVVIFLSKSGSLGVKSFQIEAIPESDTSLINSELSQWADGKPEGWQVKIGARNGAEAPVSKLKRHPDGGLLLSGNARTRAWRTVSQEITLQPGQSYQLEFEAKSTDVRREGIQFDNCYCGVWMYDDQGQRLDFVIKDLSQARRLQSHKLRFVAPQKTAKASLVIFLSKSGSLHVKNLSLEEAKPRRPFR